MAQQVKNPSAMQETQGTWVQSLGQEDPLPGGERGNRPQYSCWESPMDRGIQQATIHGVAKNWT